MAERRLIKTSIPRGFDEQAEKWFLEVDRLLASLQTQITALAARVTTLEGP